MSARSCRAVAAAVVLCGAATGRAESNGSTHEGGLVRVAVGPAYLHESWRPSDDGAGAVHTGWGPAIDLTVGRFVRPRVAIAGALQVAGIFNRDETTLGMTFALKDTIRFVDSLAALVDVYPDPARGLHAGGALGIVAVTDVDTHMGSTQTDLGFAGAVHVGWERFVSSRWSAGALFRLSLFHYGSDTPPPAATSNGLLASLLLAFTYD